MISIILPTRNRSNTLFRVAPSYLLQDHFHELIVVDDASSDSTEETVGMLKSRFPSRKIKYIRHSRREGAAAARNSGAKVAEAEFILFGEDDAFLSEDYTRTVFPLFFRDQGIGSVSGRIVYLKPAETEDVARRRFENEQRCAPYLDAVELKINHDMQFSGVIEVPFSHAIILTKTAFVAALGFDPAYRKGNGFREETDFQLNLYSKGFKNLLTNDTWCFHLSREEITTGGQRTNRFSVFFWSIVYTRHLYKKYFDSLSGKFGIAGTRARAMFCYCVRAIKVFFINPFFRLLKKAAGII